MYRCASVRRWRGIVLVLLAGLVFAPAGFAGSYSIGGAVTPTATPVGPATPADVVVFHDDFDTYSRRWEEVASAKSSVAYRAGVLTMQVVSPGVSVWSRPDFVLPAGAYTLHVGFTFRRGGLDSAAGCLLAGHEGASLIAFLVTRSGEWAIEQLSDGVWQTLMAGSVARDLAGREVDLRVDFDQGSAALWIDGLLAGRIRLQGEMPVTGLGLIARAGRGYVGVDFEQIEVWPQIAEIDTGNYE